MSNEPSGSEAYENARAVDKASARPSAKARGGRRGRVRETPQTCPGPPEGQRSPARGATGRVAPLRGASGHLRRSWCPEAAKSGSRRPRDAEGGGKAAAASAFHRPGCASASERKSRPGVQGSGKWSVPCAAPSVAGDIVGIVRKRRTDLFRIGTRRHDSSSYGLQINNSAAVLSLPTACTIALEVRLNPHKPVLALLANFNLVIVYHGCPSQHIEVV